MEFALAFAWLAAAIAASIIWRWRTGKPIFPRIPEDVTFSERRCSGRSMRNWLTRLGGARNCLLVYVSRGSLTIVPMFPFNLMFLPEVYGVELTAPVSAVRVSESTRMFGNALAFSFDGEQPLELSLHNPDAFRAALK